MHTEQRFYKKISLSGTSIICIKWSIIVRIIYIGIVMAYDPTNIFARIIKGELPCDKVYEDDAVLAFNDLHPAAPLHVLILPKGPYRSFDDFVFDADSETVKNFFVKVREIAHKLGLAEDGYRLIMNHGAHASQTIHHYHVHLLGRRHLGPLVTGDTHHV